MGDESVVLKMEIRGRRQDVPAVRVAFSAHQCFAFDGGADDLACLRAIGAHLSTLEGLALYGDGPLVDYLLNAAPELRDNLVCRVVDGGRIPHGIAREQCFDAQHLPASVRNVFLCETLAFPRMQMRQALAGHLNIIEPDIVWKLAPAAVPARAWISVEQNIYPIRIPEIRFREGMDLLLIDCPSRNLSMMPNGLGYVHNALKRTAVKFQTLDLDIIVYHRYHIHRLFDMGGRIVLPSGREAPVDPWQAENYDFWTVGSEHDVVRNGSDEVLAFFQPVIDEIVAAIVNARPKILGLSIQQCNEAFSRHVIIGVKRQLPDVLIVVGGYSCYNADIGRRGFPLADYMFIGEAELTVGPVIEAIARGERPFNQPGVLSRFDTPDHKYIPGPLPHNIDKIEFPKYEWFDDLGIYRNYNGYQLTPIIASRGCRWSRCTFCAERFYWRIRSAPNFVDELEWLVAQGCHLFMFNESDLNGMPEKVLEICDEIIRRGLHKKAKLTGQLRIHKKCTRAFFDKMRAANVVALRFGVDAFSEDTLRLQKKGYTVAMASQNLKDCWEAGIYTEVNWVIGVPGETEKDIDEGIALILKEQKYIGRLANINPLILVNGSVYWIDPAAHGIVFREPQDVLYQRYPRAVPADKWYSTKPYIDAQVRKERFERIVLALVDAGFPVGAWANRIIEDVKFARDRMRVGGSVDEQTRQRLIAEDDPAPAAGPDEQPQGNTSLAGSYGHRTINLEAAQPIDEPELAVVPPPACLRVTDTHRIIRYLDWFYAVPVGLGDVDLAHCDMSSLEGVIRAPSDDELEAILAASADWANSRGHYSPQRRQKEHGALYRAGSFFGAMASKPLAFEPTILEFSGQYYAIREEDLQDLADGLEPAGAASLPIDAIPGMKMLAAVSKGAVPELLWTVNRHNIVKFDNAYYALPHGLPIDWDSGMVALLPGVVVSKTVKEIMDRVDALAVGSADACAGSDAVREGKGSGPAAEYSKVPILLANVADYNIVSYEGWVYGIPRSLGPVDLEETDIMEMPGVIRDVSRDVVENEVMDLVRQGQLAA